MADGKQDFKELKALPIERKIKLLSKADKRILMEYMEQMLSQIRQKTNTQIPFDDKGPL